MTQPQIGYAAMLEQFHPTELIEFCEVAEQNGFCGVMAADHFQPWVPQQGQAAFVWTFMAAAAEHTKGDIGPVSRALHSASTRRSSPRPRPRWRPCIPGRSGWASGRARRSTSMSWPATGPSRPSGSRACSRPSRSSASSSWRGGRQAQRPVLQAGDDAAVDDAGRAAADLCRHRRHDHGAANRPAVRRDHHRWRRRGEDREHLRSFRGGPRRARTRPRCPSISGPPFVGETDEQAMRTR